MAMWGANFRGLVRRCRGVVDGLDVPDPFDVREMCRRASRQRGRPIVVAPLALAAAAPCGLWLDAHGTDYIFFEANTSPMHQDHIILHELGHVLCHRHGGGLDDDTLRTLFPDLDLNLVRGALGRTRYSAVEEREAEIFAGLVLGRAWRAPVAAEPAESSSDPDAHDVLRRFLSGVEG
jgi:sirohydrochlorin ferrochelatase